jgi:hypothetical protein
MLWLIYFILIFFGFCGMIAEWTRDGREARREWRRQRDRRDLPEWLWRR